MEKKARFLTIFLTLALALSGLAAISRAQASGDAPTGPYTKILLPLEDLPPLNENLAFHPVIDQYESGATLQIMYVLEDPRDVPLARYAYYSGDYGVIAPNDMPVSWSDLPEYSAGLEDLKSSSPKTINVYVRIQAPEDKEVQDPLFASQKAEDSGDGLFHRTQYNGDRPALYVYLPDQYSKGFPCAVPEYAAGILPYQIPSELEGGQAVGIDGLFDPLAYAPPRPWYYSENQTMEPGEVREGWVSCLVPDITLEDIRIRTWYKFIQPPEPTPTPGPSPTPYSDELEDNGCVVVESLDDPACQEAQCCTIILVDPALMATMEGPTPDATDMVLQETYEAERYLPLEVIGEQIAWAYNRVSFVEQDGIRLENVPLVFINAAGEQKQTQGAAALREPKVVRIAGQKKLTTGLEDTYEYLFVAKVLVEPMNYSQEELQGYTLSHIGAQVDIYSSPNGPHRSFYTWNPHSFGTSTYDQYMEANYWYPYINDDPEIENGAQPFGDLFLYRPDSPFSGYVFAYLNNALDWSPALGTDQEQKPSFLDNAWFRIGPIKEGERTPLISEYLYPASLIDITSNLESHTDMCDVVDCIDVRDPEAKINEVRTVPLLCPGEWANNFVIDGLNIEDIDYIGEPYGMGLRPEYFRAYLQLRAVPPKTWIYKGKILGGLAPWWATKSHYTSAKVIDLLTGDYLDTNPRILPYYHKDAEVYYLPSNNSSQVGGWIMGIASNKLLIFDVIQKADSVKENRALLFMEEGPAWTSSCSRSLLPALSSSEAYVPQNVGIDVDLTKNSHVLLELMPGMEYPVSEPRISGDMFQIGEEGPVINEQILRPLEVKIVPGRANKPIVYVPYEDKYYPAAKNETDNNAVFFGRVEAELIPPDSSLVMVKLEKISPEGQLDCRTSPDKIQLSYPGYYPITTSPKILQEFNLGVLLWLCSDDDFTEKWLVFKFPSLDIDPSELLLSIKGEDNWVFWNLTEK